MSDLEKYQKALDRKKEEYKENIKNGIEIKHEIDQLKQTICRLEKGVKSVLPVGTEITFKDEDEEIIKTVIVENYKERQTLILLSDYWRNQELSKWYMFDYTCIYSDTLIEEFCNEYNVEIIAIEDKSR
jgi:hypothetical protein